MWNDKHTYAQHTECLKQSTLCVTQESPLLAATMNSGQTK